MTAVNICNLVLQIINNIFCLFKYILFTRRLTHCLFTLARYTLLWPLYVVNCGFLDTNTVYMHSSFLLLCTVQNTSVSIWACLCSAVLSSFVAVFFYFPVLGTVYNIKSRSGVQFLDTNLANKADCASETSVTIGHNWDPGRVEHVVLSQRGLRTNGRWQWNRPDKCNSMLSRLGQIMLNCGQFHWIQMTWKFLQIVVYYMQYIGLVKKKKSLYKNNGYSYTKCSVNILFHL